LLQLVVEAAGSRVPSHSSKVGHVPKSEPPCLSDKRFEIPRPAGRAVQSSVKSTKA